MFLYVFLIVHNSHEHSLLFNTANFRNDAEKMKERNCLSFILQLELVEETLSVCMFSVGPTSLSYFMYYRIELVKGLGDFLLRCRME